MTESQYTIDVLGEKIAVTVRGDLSFEATYADQRFSADSRTALEEKLKRHVRGKRVEAAIPVILDHGEKFQRAVLRRRHASRRAFLFDTEAGPIALDYPHIIALGSEVTDVELAALNELRAQHKALERQVLRTIAALHPHGSLNASGLLEAVPAAPEETS